MYILRRLIYSSAYTGVHFTFGCYNSILWYLPHRKKHKIKLYCFYKIKCKGILFLKNYYNNNSSYYIDIYTIFVKLFTNIISFSIYRIMWCFKSNVISIAILWWIYRFLLFTWIIFIFSVSIWNLFYTFINIVFSFLCNNCI